MLPKLFLENHFTGKVNDNLFVAMASDGTDEEKIKAIKMVISKSEETKYFKDIVYIQDDLSTNDITYKIFDAITQSRTLLFDLSNDMRLCLCNEKKETGRVNSNVMYELGVALTVRNPNSIILIRKISDGPLEKVPFDIRGIGMQTYDDINKTFLNKIFCEQEKRKSYFSRKLLSGVSDLIDEIGYFIIDWALHQPEGYKHFGFYLADDIRTNYSKFKIRDDQSNNKIMEYKASNEEFRMSVFRLMDLGILVKKSGFPAGLFEHAYHWTEFGKEILEYVKEVRSG